MSSPTFKEALSPYGVKVLHPETNDMKKNVVTVIERIYQNQTEGAASDIDEIVKGCISVNDLSNTAVCLGCTELPLAFNLSNNLSSFEHKNIQYLNASAVHDLVNKWRQIQITLTLFSIREISLIGKRLRLKKKAPVNARP